MNKILVVAQSEFATLVRSKAFVIGILLLPVVMIGSVMLSRATRNPTDNIERSFAIVDHTGVLSSVLVEAAGRITALPGGQPPPRSDD